MSNLEIPKLIWKDGWSAGESRDNGSTDLNETSYRERLLTRITHMVLFILEKGYSWDNFLLLQAKPRAFASNNKLRRSRLNINTTTDTTFIYIKHHCTSYYHDYYSHRVCSVVILRSVPRLASKTDCINNPLFRLHCLKTVSSSRLSLCGRVFHWLRSFRMYIFWDGCRVYLQTSWCPRLPPYSQG